jgi:hypothetical protein
MLTALSKAEGQRCATSFVTAAYSKHASFQRIHGPCIWSFLLCHLILTFYEIIKIGKKRKVWHGIGENTLKVKEEIPLGFGGR